MSDKLALYANKIGLDMLDVLSRDSRLRPTFVDGVWMVSMVGLMEVFGDTSYSPRATWRDEKKRLFKRKPELREKISQLKLTAADGKKYLTDVASVKTALTILMYMETPSSDKIKDLAAEILAHMTEAELNYRVRNIAGGYEWAADTIHKEMIDQGAKMTWGEDGYDDDQPYRRPKRT